MSAPQLLSVPFDQPILPGKQPGDPGQMPSEDYLNFFYQMYLVLQSAARVAAQLVLKDLSAALGLTPIGADALGSGHYIVHYYLHVLTPASVSSQVQVTISWVDAGVAMSRTGVLVNGNLITSHDEDSFPLDADNAPAIEISTTYAAVGTPMHYKLTATVLTVRQS